MNIIYSPHSEESYTDPKLGSLRLRECYFIGGTFEGVAHPGMRSPEGGITILHVPTKDVWLLSPINSGSRQLNLWKVIDGSSIPTQLEETMKLLLQEAKTNCLEGLAPETSLPSILEISKVCSELESLPKN